MDESCACVPENSAMDVLSGKFYENRYLSQYIQSLWYNLVHHHPPSSKGNRLFPNVSSSTSPFDPNNRNISNHNSDAHADSDNSPSSVEHTGNTGTAESGDSRLSTVATTGIYNRLAIIYDEIMKDVDYEDWTDYIDTIIRFHHPAATRVLELACGTGIMALEMELRDEFDITATDISPEMIRIARKKGAFLSSDITWKVQDMCRLDLDDTFDAIYMVFDSLNYLLTETEIQALFDSAARHLHKKGIFVFDFTTPSYSSKIALLLNEKRDVNESYRYTRTNEYDREQRIHTNHFEVEQVDPKTGKVIDRFEEKHRQRIRTFQEMKNMVLQSDLRMLAAYEDFDLEEATDKSDRITMILSHD